MRSARGMTHRAFPSDRGAARAPSTLYVTGRSARHSPMGGQYSVLQCIASSPQWALVPRIVAICARVRNAMLQTHALPQASEFALRNGGTTGLDHGVLCGTLACASRAVWLDASRLAHLHGIARPARNGSSSSRCLGCRTREYSRSARVTTHEIGRAHV